MTWSLSFSKKAVWVWTLKRFTKKRTREKVYLWKHWTLNLTCILKKLKSKMSHNVYIKFSFLLKYCMVFPWHYCVINRSDNKAKILPRTLWQKAILWEVCNKWMSLHFQLFWHDASSNRSKTLLIRQQLPKSLYISHAHNWKCFFSLFKIHNYFFKKRFNFFFILVLFNFLVGTQQYFWKKLKFIFCQWKNRATALKSCS